MDFSQVCVAGPGASGISVDGLPPLPDPDALDSQGQALAASGNAVHSGVNDAAKSWAGLSSAYEAPEAGQVLTAFNPAFSRSQELANLTSNAATVLAAYADRARELKQRINTLRAEVHALDELIGGNDDWRSNLTIVDRHRNTMDKASALAQAILDSDATCATALSALTGGQSYHPPTIPRANLNSSTDMTANGFTHVQHFMGNDEKLPDLPWGPPNISVRLGGAGSAGQGFTSALIGAFQGLHTLLFTTDTAKQVQAWQGMFALGAAALTTRNVFARGGKDMTSDEAQAVLTTLNVAKETIHYDEWGTDPGYAIGATTFDVGSMFIGGTGLGIKGASLGGKLGAETAALTKAATLSKATTSITGATRTMLGETATASTAKLTQARTAIWDNGVGTALDKLDNGLAKLNQTLNGPQPALANAPRVVPDLRPSNTWLAHVDGRPTQSSPSGDHLLRAETGPALHNPSPAESTLSEVHPERLQTGASDSPTIALPHGGLPPSPQDYPRPSTDRTIQISASDGPSPRTAFAGRSDLEPNSAYFVEGRGDFYTDNQGKVTYVETQYGRRGNLNADLIQMQPDTTYVVHPDIINPVDGASHAHVFQTDAEGRSILAHTDQLALGVADRSESIQSRVGDYGGDGYDGGHIFANGFGGGGEDGNIVAMIKRLNRGAGESYFNLENGWRSTLRAEPAAKIAVDFRSHFLNSDKLAQVFEVQYQVNDGPKNKREFQNE